MVLKISVSDKCIVPVNCMTKRSYLNLVKVQEFIKG